MMCSSFFVAKLKISSTVSVVEYMSAAKAFEHVSRVYISLYTMFDVP